MNCDLEFEIKGIVMIIIIIIIIIVDTKQCSASNHRPIEGWPRITNAQRVTRDFQLRPNYVSYSYEIAGTSNATKPG